MYGLTDQSCLSSTKHCIDCTAKKQGQKSPWVAKLIKKQTDGQDDYKTYVDIG